MPTYTPNITEPYVYTDFVNVMNRRSFKTLNIYVNSVTGSDSGPGRGGSATSAWKSLKNALNDAFSLMRNSMVQIHLAGATAHEIPDGFQFPAVQSPDQITIDSAPTYGFNKKAPLVLRAAPTLVTTITALQVSSQANNTNSGMKEITTTGGLTADAFNGKFLVDANGVMARIYDNTTTVIKLDYAGSDLTAPLAIYSPGATVSPADDTSNNPTVMLRGSSCPIVFEGIAFTASAGGAVQVGPGQQAFFLGCTIPSLEVGKGLNTNLNLKGSVECVACDLDSVSIPNANLNISNSRFTAGEFTNTNPQSRVTISACSFESMTKPAFSDQTTSPGFLSLTNCLLTGASGPNVHQIGGLLEMSTCDVAAAGSIGVFCEKQASAKLTTVTSNSANGTYGLALDTGAVVEVTSGTTIAGTSAQIFVTGLAPISFAVFRTATPYNIKLALNGCNLFQTSSEAATPQGPTRNVTSNATLSGSDDFVTVDTAGGSVTLTLPPAAAMKGRRLTAIKTAAANNMVLDGDGAETINGAATKTTATQYGTLTIESDGTQWWIVSTFGTIT